MKCRTATRINEGKLTPAEKKVAREYGARALASVTSVNFNKDSIGLDPVRVKSTKDFLTKYKTRDKMSQMHNYVFTSSEVSHEGMERMRSTLQLGTGSNTLPFGITPLSEGLAGISKIFEDSGRLLNDTMLNREPQVLIHGGSASDVVTISGAKTFHIDGETLKGLSQFDNTNDGNHISFLVTSALARGFDVVITGATNVEAIKKGVNYFNQKLKPGYKATLASNTVRNVEGVRMYNNVDNYIKPLRTPDKLYRNPKVVDSDPLLNEFLSDEDRKVLEKTRELQNSDRLTIGHALMKSFKKTVPGIEYELLGMHEIKQRYGKDFATKKGFIINGKIVINLNTFTGDTMFHEFSHFFFKWLKTNNIEIYNELMSEAVKLPNYKNVAAMYRRTGMELTKEEVAEEAFAVNIGLNANKEFNRLIKSEGAENMFNDKVDAFMMDFTTKLVGKATKKTNLNIYSTVSDIFNYQYENINPNTEHLFNENGFIKSFRNFSYQKISFDEGYKMMFAKNLFRLTPSKTSPGAFDVHLFDAFGNAMGINGEASPSNFAGRVFRDVKPGSTEEANNKALRKSLETFVSKFIDSIDVKFDATINFGNIQDIAVNDIRRSSATLKLNADETKYVDADSNEYDRVTGYTDDAFSDAVAEDYYVRAKMVSELKEEISIRYGKRETDDIAEIAAIDEKVNKEVADIMNNTEGSTYKDKYAEIESIFKVKQEEGTFLHGIAELFVRTMNYTDKINYNTKYEKTKTYFMDQILEAISNKDRDVFREYYKKFFFDEITDKTTQEFKDFQNIYNIIDRDMTIDDASRISTFLLKLKTKLNKDIFDVYPGPVELLPEVKVANKEMGTAGTIDLLVVDRNGTAHIFDYKTKEVGKTRNWNFPSEVRMTNEFSGYRSNAKMKASLQTSMYKVMLQRLGVKTGASKVFYIEGTLDATMFNKTDKKDLRYKVSEIKTEPLVEVTSEIYEHFSDALKIEVGTISHDIAEAVFKATGGENIDIQADMDLVVDRIYKDAAEKSSGVSGVDLSMFGITNSAEGMVIFLSGNVRHVVPKSVIGEKNIKKYIKEALEKQVPAKAKLTELEQLFQDSNMKLSSTKKNVYSALLAGSTMATHEFVKMSSILDLGSDFSGMAMLKDTVTGQHRVIILNHDEERSMKFGNNDLTRQHLFGNFITKHAADNILPQNLPKGTNHSMRMFKAGLMIMRMKQLDPSFTVSHVVSNNKNTSITGAPGFVDMDQILGMTVGMIKVMIENGVDLPISIKSLVEDSSLVNPRSYVANPIDSLIEYLDNVLDSGTISNDEVVRDMIGKTGKPRTEALRKALDEFDGRSNLDKVFTAIHEVMHTVGQKLTTDEQKINSRLWELLDNTMMTLFDFNFNLMPSNPRTIDKYVSASSMSSNAYQAFLNSRINNSKTAISNEFMEFKQEFNNLMSDVATDYGVTLGGPQVRLSLKDIFKNLFKDPSNSTRGTAYILKSPDDVNKQSEKKLLTYMRDTFQRFADETVPSSGDSKKVIPYGWMPLIKRSRLSFMSSDSDPISFAKTLLVGMDNHMISQDNADGSRVSNSFNTANPFAEQMPNKDQSNKPMEQFTGKRRMRLSIDQFGAETSTAPVNPLNMIEDNLENVMDSFVLASLETKHYKDITAFGKAMLFNVKRLERDSSSDFSQLVDTFGIIQKKIINHETSEQKGPLLNGINKFATNVVVAGRIHQVLLEMFTNPMVTASLFFSDLIYGKMFKGTRKFSSESFGKAMQYVVDRGDKREVIKKIDMLFGMTNSDNTHVKDMLNQLEKKGIFQSDNLMYLNKLFLDTWQQVAMTAYLIEQGSFDAYHIDDYGNLKYDEKEDKRFFTGKRASTAENSLKRDTYDKVKDKIGKERGGLSGISTDKYGDRKLNWGMAPTERTMLKNLITQTYSSMDEESKGLIMYYTSMSLFNKMRSWIFPKVPRYFAKHKTAAQNEHMAQLVKVPDASTPSGFRMEWQSSPTEGIFYTGRHILKSFADLKLDVFKKGKGVKLEEYQKENLSKLMGDMFVWSFFVLAGVGLFSGLLDDEQRKDPTLQLLYKRYMAATGDVFLAYSLLDVTSGQGSMFIGLSIAQNALNSLWNVGTTAAAMSYRDDVGSADLITALNKLGKSSHGLYTTGATVYDAIEHGK